MSGETAEAPGADTFQEAPEPAGESPRIPTGDGLFGPDDKFEEEDAPVEKPAPKAKKPQKKPEKPAKPDAKKEGEGSKTKSDLFQDSEPEPPGEGEAEEETKEAPEEKEGEAETAEPADEAKEEGEEEADEEALDNDFEVEAEITIDGKRVKRRVPLETLVRSYQLEQASHKRFEEAAELVKSSKEMQKLFFQRPYDLLLSQYRRAFQEQGLDENAALFRAAEEVRKTASQFLRPYLEEANLPPEERERRQLQRDNDRMRKENERLRVQREKEEFEAKSEAFAQHRRRAIREAMAQTGLKFNPVTANDIDKLMWRWKDAGIELSPLEATQRLLQEEQERTQELLGRMSVEQLHKLRPDLATHQSQQNLATVKQKQRAAVFGEKEGVPQEDRPQGQKKPKKFADSWDELFPEDRARRAGQFE